MKFQTSNMCILCSYHFLAPVLYIGSKILKATVTAGYIYS